MTTSHAPLTTKGSRQSAPAAVLPGHGSTVFAPADGRVIAIERATDPFTDIAALRISVFMNRFSAHHSFSPADATIEGVLPKPQIDHPTGTQRRPMGAVVFRMASGARISWVQFAGAFFRRLPQWLKVGARLKKGQPLGPALYGSRIDMYMPLHFVPCVTIGESVSASSTVIAECL